MSVSAVALAHISYSVRPNSSDQRWILLDYTHHLTIKSPTFNRTQSKWHSHGNASWWITRSHPLFKSTPHKNTISISEELGASLSRPRDEVGGRLGRRRFSRKMKQKELHCHQALQKEIAPRFFFFMFHRLIQSHISLTAVQLQSHYSITFNELLHQ